MHLKFYSRKLYEDPILYNKKSEKLKEIMDNQSCIVYHPPHSSHDGVMDIGLIQNFIFVISNYKNIMIIVFTI